MIAFKVKAAALKAESDRNTKPIDFAIGEVAREFENMDVGLVAVRKAWEHHKDLFEGMDAKKIRDLMKRLSL